MKAGMRRLGHGEGGELAGLVDQHVPGGCGVCLGERVLSPEASEGVEEGHPFVSMCGLPKETPTGRVRIVVGVSIRMANALALEVGASLGSRKAHARFSLRIP